MVYKTDLDRQHKEHEEPELHLNDWLNEWTNEQTNIYIFHSNIRERMTLNATNHSQFLS